MNSSVNLKCRTAANDALCDVYTDNKITCLCETMAIQLYGKENVEHQQHNSGYRVQRYELKANSLHKQNMMKSTCVCVEIFITELRQVQSNATDTLLFFITS